jgi:hypothetical protein
LVKLEAAVLGDLFGHQLGHALNRYLGSRFAGTTGYSAGESLDVTVAGVINLPVA